jgi:ferritin
MLSDGLQKALNGQVNAELYSSYLYLAMSMYFEDAGLPGAASWMKIQAQEELWHAWKFMDYINERGGRVLLEAIAKPEGEWSSSLDAFETVLAHERRVSSLIGGLVELARAEKDYMTDNFLQWFVAEQVEEEATADEVVRKFGLAGDAGGNLLLLDRELGQRVYTPPATGEQEK